MNFISSLINLLVLAVTINLADFRSIAQRYGYGVPMNTFAEAVEASLLTVEPRQGSSTTAYATEKPSITTIPTLGRCTDVSVTSVDPGVLHALSGDESLREPSKIAHSDKKPSTITISASETFTGLSADSDVLSGRSSDAVLCADEPSKELLTTADLTKQASTTIIPSSANFSDVSASTVQSEVLDGRSSETAHSDHKPLEGPLTTAESAEKSSTTSIPTSGQYTDTTATSVNPEVPHKTYPDTTFFPDDSTSDVISSQESTGTTVTAAQSSILSTNILFAKTVKMTEVPASTTLPITESSLQFSPSDSGTPTEKSDVSQSTYYATPNEPDDSSSTDDAFVIVIPLIPKRHTRFYKGVPVWECEPMFK